MVLARNSLIINAIHFSGSLRVKLWLLKGMYAFAGNFCFEVRYTIGSVGCYGKKCGDALENYMLT